MPIEKKLAKLLTKKNFKLSIAESCTGGLLSNKITNISGSSEFFKLGIIAYSNAAKVKLLKVPIRIISIATSVFWVFLIAFAVSAAYSVRESTFEFGEPQVLLTQNQELMLSTPIYIENRGFYSIADFNITTFVSNSNGFLIEKDTTIISIISKGRIEGFQHNLTLNLDELIENNEQYLYLL